MKRKIFSSIYFFFFFAVTAFSALFLSSPVDAISDHVVVNEVLYNPFGTDTGQEWIKLYNPTDNAINLEGFQLNATSGDYYTFSSVNIPSKSFIKIYWAADGTNSDTDLYTERTGFSNMGNTYGWVALFKNSTHSKDTIVDYIEYGEAGKTWESIAADAGIWEKGSFITNVDEGSSIKLKIDSEDSNSVNDWQSFLYSTPTPSPSPTIIDTPTLTPTKSPTPTKALTPKIILTPKLTATLKSVVVTKFSLISTNKSLTPSKVLTKTVQKEVLGEKNKEINFLTKTPTASETPTIRTEVLGTSQNNILSKVLIGLGSVFILACGILAIKTYRKERNQN